MVIYNRDRRQCGTFIGRIELKTVDESLKKPWAEKIVHIPPQTASYPPHPQHRHLRNDTESHIHGSHVHDSSWEDTVVAILREHGY
jgi:hypothetical protein